MYVNNCFDMYYFHFTEKVRQTGVWITCYLHESEKSLVLNSASIMSVTVLCSDVHFN